MRPSAVSSNAVAQRLKRQVVRHRGGGGQPWPGQGGQCAQECGAAGDQARVRSVFHD
jgi:hypothetical protein